MSITRFVCMWIPFAVGLALLHDTYNLPAPVRIATLLIAGGCLFCFDHLITVIKDSNKS